MIIVWMLIMNSTLLMLKRIIKMIIDATARFTERTRLNDIKRKMESIILERKLRRQSMELFEKYYNTRVKGKDDETK